MTWRFCKVDLRDITDKVEGSVESLVPNLKLAQFKWRIVKQLLHLEPHETKVEP